MMNSHRALTLAFSLCLAACMEAPEAPPADGDGVAQSALADGEPSASADGIGWDDASILAVPPSITPNTPTERIPVNGTYSCDVGNFCAIVKDPTTGGWTVFKMFNCTTYHMHNWNGAGFYYNNQTGANTTTLFYNQRFEVIRTIVRGTGAPKQVPVDWTPVWHIKNC